jgi:hypothetical protein
MIATVVGRRIQRRTKQAKFPALREHPSKMYFELRRREE